MIISPPDSHGVGSSSSLTWAQDTRRPVPRAPAIRRNCRAGERSRSSTLNPDAGMPARLGCEPHSHKPLSCDAHYCHSPRLAATLFRNSLILDRLPFNAAGLKGATVRLFSRSPQSLNPRNRGQLRRRGRPGRRLHRVRRVLRVSGRNLQRPQGLRREHHVRRGPRGPAELHLPDGLPGLLLDQQPGPVPVPDVAAAVLDRRPQPDRGQPAAEPGRGAGVLQREHRRDDQPQALPVVRREAASPAATWSSGSTC